MEYKLLNGINSPFDVKSLDERQIPELCKEIRAFLVENVERQGGHLASNLGVCELTVALHRIFNSPEDKIVFDVGHQSYVHKIITGRRDRFDTLRSPGGLSGFTHRKESAHDPFGAGHSSTSVSAAVGFAEAEKLAGGKNYSIAVIGDGAYTGGMVHEALNNSSSELRLIIILNENGMSISLNKGAFSSYLTRVRISKRYRGFKSGTKNFLGHIALVGKPLTRFLEYVKSKIKNIFMAPNYFEDLGLYYIGPVDGNDYKKVAEALTEAKELEKCVIVHVKTKKGKGYPPAEESPDDFHSINAENTPCDSFHTVFSDELIALSEDNKRIVAVTAAMGKGTGLDAFGEKYPDRYFDVGIAEPHALTFSAGLAASGLSPYVAIYSTFLQRGYDSVIHDICLQNLPVRIIVDRASLATSDGATHHGIFDVAFLSHIPSMRIFAPITYGSLRAVLKDSTDISSPIAIRYPNKRESELIRSEFYSDGDYSNYGVRTDFIEDNIPKKLFITYGSIAEEVILAKRKLLELGEDVGIILLEALKPYREIAEKTKNYILAAEKVIFVEEGIKNGGAGMLLASALSELSVKTEEKYTVLAIDDSFAEITESTDIYRDLGLCHEALVKKMSEN